MDRAALLAHHRSRKMKGSTFIQPSSPPTVGMRLSYLFQDTSYGNYPDIEALWDQYNKAIDPRVRKDLIGRIQRLIYERVMYLPLSSTGSLNAVGPRVKGDPWKNERVLGFPCSYEDMEIEARLFQTILLIISASLGAVFLLYLGILHKISTSIGKVWLLLGVGMAAWAIAEFIYTYLDSRFGYWSYKTGASFFLLSRIIGTAFRLYLMASVLHMTVFGQWGVPFWVTVVVTLGLIWLYTRKGGIRTVIWTDIIQTPSF
jgi:hypothetical protein